MTDAVIMAGGRSERMRATAGPTHKSLVPILGVPLIERNLCALLSAGFRDIAVVANAREDELAQFVHHRATQLAASCNARVSFVIEGQPLGTIGIAAQIDNPADAVVFVNVDNLTTLDLQAFRQHQQQSAAAMTVACHHEPFQIPFGEVQIEDGCVVGYREKPVEVFSVSSGLNVLGRVAFETIPTDRRCDVPELVRLLTAAGELVSAFEHNSHWIDINDADAVSRADELVLENHSEFELWARKPDSEVVELLLYSTEPAVLLRRERSIDAQLQDWRLPSVPLNWSNQTPDSAVELIIQSEPRWRELSPQKLITFDSVDSGKGNLIRHHVFQAEAGATPLGRNGNPAWRWISFGELAPPFLLAQTVTRSCEALRVHQGLTYGETHSSSLGPQQVGLRGA